MRALKIFFIKKIYEWDNEVIYYTMKSPVLKLSIVIKSICCSITAMASESGDLELAN